MRIKSIDTLYHGSDKEFEKIDLRYANAFKDYGKGFYLTSSYQHAQKWAQQKGKNKPITYIYSYSINHESLCEGQWEILELLKYDKNWIDFIVKSRIKGVESGYDNIYDRIADNTYKSISEILLKYSNNDVPHQEAIKNINLKRIMRISIALRLRRQCPC